MIFSQFTSTKWWNIKVESLISVLCVQVPLVFVNIIVRTQVMTWAHVYIYQVTNQRGLSYTLTKRFPFSLRMVTPVRLSNLLSEYVTFKSCSMLPRLSTVWTRCVGIYAQCWSVEVLKYWWYDGMIYTGRKQIHVNCDWILFGRVEVSPPSHPAE